MKRREILFLATEDWFVRSHFLPLVRRAVAEGFEVVVWARDSGALSQEHGVRVIGADFDRLKVLPWDLHRQTADLKEVLARERPDVVHAIALKPILLFLQSGHRASCRVLALTGRGFLAADASPWKRLLSAHIRRVLTRAIADRDTIALVENEDDRRWIGGTSNRIVLMPGAGVDPNVFLPSPEPQQGMAVGVLSRLIRSKGIDIAVRAVGELRARGVNVSLMIGGAVDRQNPDRYSDAEIDLWRQIPGVVLVGRVGDVPAFWRGVHIACLPSRGGEGLPRTLLEAAACGRPIVTTNTPGCADFVVDGETGLIVPGDDARGLAKAIERLAADMQLRSRMGAAGRARVVAGYTERHAADCAAQAWRAVTAGA